MGQDSKIAWTDHTFNPWWGCEKVSAGCAHCYADTFAKRLGHGATKPKLWGPGSERKIASESMWREPLKWNRAAEKAGTRARVFCASMADVFEDRVDLFVPRARLAILIAQTPHLDWLLLTKRPENADRLWKHALRHVEGAEPDVHVRPWAPNTWLGTTAENQEEAERRIPRLLAVPAAVRFLSCEPLLEELNLRVLRTDDFTSTDALTGERSYAGRGNMPGHDSQYFDRGVDWLIVGGESGHGARPFDLAWARSLRDQCAKAGVPFFMKQMGANPGSFPARDGESEYGVALRARAGEDPAEWPADLRVRQFPEPR